MIPNYLIFELIQLIIFSYYLISVQDLKMHHALLKFEFCKSTQLLPKQLYLIPYVPHFSYKDTMTF